MLGTMLIGYDVEWDKPGDVTPQFLDSARAIHGRVLFFGILATMMIPNGVGLIPNFIIMARLQWVNTYWPLIVPGIANAFGIFWMRQYCLSLPDELIDAARIDGARAFGIF